MQLLQANVESEISVKSFHIIAYHYSGSMEYLLYITWFPRSVSYILGKPTNLFLDQFRFLVSLLHPGLRFVLREKNGVTFR